MIEKPVYVTAKVPPQLKTEIVEAIKTGRYMNESDLIRTALRNLMDEDKEAS